MKSRALVVLILLCGTALAGPGSWQAEVHGSSPDRLAAAGGVDGSADQLLVTSGALVSFVLGEASTTLFASAQAASASSCSESWFTLRYVGSDETVNHRWRITTRIHGYGNGSAETVLDGSANGESVQAVVITGDNENGGAGILGVHDNGSVGFTLGFPAGPGISIDKRGKSLGTDTYVVDRTRTTTGPGKACRASSEVTSKARVSVASVVGSAFVHLRGELRCDLTMIGLCDYRDVRVEDVYRVTRAFLEPRRSVTEAPSGGVTAGEGAPTATPTGEERDGETEDRPTVDADDLEEDDPEEPAADDDEPAEEGVGIGVEGG
jgi:hypothetical protein